MGIVWNFHAALVLITHRKVMLCWLMCKLCIIILVLWRTEGLICDIWCQNNIDLVNSVKSPSRVNPKVDKIRERSPYYQTLMRKVQEWKRYLGMYCSAKFDDRLSIQLREGSNNIHKSENDDGACIIWQSSITI